MSGQQETLDVAAFSATLEEYKAGLLAQVETTLNASVRRAELVAEAWGEAAREAASELQHPPAAPQLDVDVS